MIAINIKELECFISISECGSITKAAANLYISPQGLSSLVKKIETELEVTLLDRSANGVALNEYGTILLDKAKKIVKTNEELQNEIKNLKRLENGMICMVSAYGVLRRLSPEFIFEFTKQNPAIHLDYMEFPDKYIEDMVIEEKADIGYAIGPIDDELFEKIFLYEEEIMLLVRNDDELASNTSISIKDIKDRKFIIESNIFKIHTSFIEKCKKHGFVPNIVFSTSGYSLCHKLCAEGKGISLTLKRNIAEMKNNDLIAIPFDEDFKWLIYMITKKKGHREDSLKKLIDFSKNWEI